MIYYSVKRKFEIGNCEEDYMMNIKKLLFPKKVAPVRIVGFRLFNVGGRIRWWIDLLKK